MALSIGIVGLPNVGKSTLFNALTRKGVLAANYPFATIDPSVGVVAVPDSRLEVLAKLSDSAKVIPAAVEFVDIAGLVRGASEGQGLGNKFLAHIRETDAIAQIVRIFDDADITHVDGDVDPVRDIETVNLELVLADMETCGKRLGSLERDAKRGDKDALIEKEALLAVGQALETGKLASSVLHTLNEKHIAKIKLLQLLTAKPILYVLNKKAGGHNLDEENGERFRKLTNYLESIHAQYVTVDAGIEQELSEVALGDKEMFRQELGVMDDGIDALIRAGYSMLGLITFLTTGPEETRAWTIVRGSTAPVAGTAIHTDFRDKFIRAEVVAYDQLVEAGSYAAAREKGWVRTEGKEYIVKDGDVIEFKI
jgi:ribosome-binding ATPase